VKRTLTLILALLLTFTAAAFGGRRESSYKGRYSGPYIVEEGSAFGKQSGKFTFNIGRNGGVTGKAENYTVGRSADISGSVNEDGDISLLLEWSDSTFTMKGTVIKTREGHLKGTLAQYAGKEVMATIKMDLSPR
jgi:hypothetical protein